MIRINGEQVAFTEDEFGTEYEWEGKVVTNAADSREAAEELATITGGKLVKRTVCFTRWIVAE